MWYRSAQNFFFYKPPLELEFNDKLNQYLTNLVEFPDYTENQIKKYEDLIEALKNKKIPAGVKYSNPQDAKKGAAAFYKNTSQETINKIIEQIELKIKQLKDPAANIPFNIGSGGTAAYIKAMEALKLKQKLDRGSRGSLTKSQAYLFDVDDLINRNKKINLIADSSIQMKPIFNENDLEELSKLLKDSNFEYINNILKKYKLYIYTKDNQKYIGSL